jgi:hypothetical protein
LVSDLKILYLDYQYFKIDFQKVGRVQDAALDARKSFIDYNIDAPAINWMRNTVTPFLAYTYRIIPILAETAIVRPWKYAKYAALRIWLK